MVMILYFLATKLMRCQTNFATEYIYLWLYGLAGKNFRIQKKDFYDDVLCLSDKIMRRKNVFAMKNIVSSKKNCIPGFCIWQ